MIRTSIRRVLAPVLAAALLAGGLVVSSPPAEAAGRSALWVSIANIGMRANPPIEPLIRDQKPDVVVLTEAKRARSRLTTLGNRYGYTLKQYRKGRNSERHNIALLVRKSPRIKIVKVSLLEMQKPWRYAGKKRDPRRYPAVELQARGHRWNVVGVHLPPLGATGKNHAAWNESKDALKRYATKQAPEAVVLAGDFNEHNKLMAQKFSGFDRMGENLDWALAKRNAGSDVVKMTKHKVPSGMNSHGWMTFKIIDR